MADGWTERLAARKIFRLKDDCAILRARKDRLHQSNIPEVVLDGAVRESSGFSVHPIPCYWFRFPAQSTKAFYPFKVGELVAALSKKV